MTQYEYKVMGMGPVAAPLTKSAVDQVNAELARYAAEGWTLVETTPPIPLADGVLLLFRRAVPPLDRLTGVAW